MVGTTFERATSEGAAEYEAARRVCLLSDDLSGRADEGAKKWTVAIAAALRGRHKVALLSARGPSAVPEVQVVPTGRSLIGRRLRDELRRCRPVIGRAVWRDRE